jgi:hypothetical protein
VIVPADCSCRERLQPGLQSITGKTVHETLKSESLCRHAGGCLGANDEYNKKKIYAQAALDQG